jgi:hypothetical protein
MGKTINRTNNLTKFWNDSPLGVVVYISWKNCVLGRKIRMKHMITSSLSFMQRPTVKLVLAV